MQTLKRLKYHIILILILAIGAFLRLYMIRDYLTFLGDEGRDVLVAYNILHGHLTFLGPTASVGGFFLGPIYYYFMAPFLWLFHYDPVGPAVMVAFFGIATIWLTYHMASEFFGKTAGITASFLYAVSPLVVTYSHSSWNPNLMPFFSLLALYLLYKAVVKESFKLFLIVGILFGILMQLHYLELFVGAAIMVYVIACEWHKKKLQNIIKNGALLFIGFLIGMSPFLAFEGRHGFPNTKSVFNFIFHSGETGSGMHFFQTVYNVFSRLFGRLILNFPADDKLKMYSSSTLQIWMYASIALGLFSIGIFLYQYKRVFSKTAKSAAGHVNFYKYTIIFLWLFFGVVLFGFYKKSIYDYYFEFMFPLPFLLIGNSLQFLFRKKLPFQIVAAVLFVALAFLNLRTPQFVQSANGQLQNTEDIAKFVLDKTDNKPFNFALITGGNSDHAYRYFFTIWGHPPVTIQNPQVDPDRKTVTQQLMVVCELNPCGPLGYSLYEVAGFGRADITGHWHVIVVDVYKLVHYKGK
ncbi:MAG TPA: glycosyltransferase family 39 protein [Candidatus Saccharimonadales bacterium]|nr:glycosyltransferase family 39 protein [Candidatus Saccharimonadales bacterium]